MLTKDRIGGILILAFCAFYAFKIGDIRLLPFQRGDAFTARTMPMVLAVLGIGLAAILVIRPSRNLPDLRGLDWGRVAFFLVWMSIYGLSVRPLGFLISTTLFLAVGFAVLGERRLWLLAAVSVPLVVLFWLLMTQGLEVYIAPFPEGWN
ncbi:tripartite tricarboxylate transporter TctB family protein [Pseudaestuariivita rosea]|uniref:tripartite tricarboxylate transporter TctB family protein n=1 Tax=Pseudaestuariivita rosea TaxID=2763263 RepID=UPI001ABAB1E1|nr:tripartite tricarboxylate transporter TctB family protein [Pseudaestuariivita rosea]